MAIIEEIKNSTAVRVYRQGWLAWLGAHKAAFDLAQDGVGKLVNGRQQLIDELVEKGESVEEIAKGNVDKVRDFVEPRFTDVSEKVSTVTGKVFNRTQEVTTDPLAELSADVAKLAKTVSGLSRKVNSFSKPAPKKAAPKKTATKTAPKAAPKAGQTATDTKAAA